MSEAPKRPRLTRKTNYDNVSEITGKEPGRERWSDDDILSYQSIQLFVLSDDEMLTEVSIFLHGIQEEMTPRAAASALLLTWNMRSTEPVEQRIFPTIDSGMAIEDIPITKLEKKIRYTDVDTDSMITRMNASEVRRAGAFTAASTLKMFAKDASSWTKAWNDAHIQQRYKDFTKEKYPFENIFPRDKQIEELCSYYQSHKLFIGTLGRILYAVADVADRRQLSMLFDQHLSFTGLHIIPQFIMAKLNIGARTSDLLSALDMRQNTDTLDQLTALINTSLCRPIDSEHRGTWRFARLFDQTALSQLQTKYAQDTVGVLAHINKLCQKTTDKSNPLNIAVLRSMGPARMKTLKMVAKLIYHYFTVTERAMENEFYDIDTHQILSDDEDEDDMEG